MLILSTSIHVTYMWCRRNMICIMHSSQHKDPVFSQFNAKRKTYMFFSNKERL